MDNDLPNFATESNVSLCGIDIEILSTKPFLQLHYYYHSAAIVAKSTTQETV